ncbi:ABC-type enterochelin transport system substrate-binding protein [Rhodococcus sp. 27YEA15]|uniref:DM13 domain-containing protein n=1 Tax=Rhodococcus sp. 27YEA15 TaxID=3156259 RepID=UPI003C7D65A1
MRTKVGIAIASLSLTLVLGACSSQNDTPAAGSSTTVADTSAAAAMTRGTSHELSGTFAGLNDKKVTGVANVTGNTLTLSGFSSDEGPDLHLYLTNGTDEAAVSVGVELGSVAFANASQTFTLNGANASTFTDLVVHCDKAKAVFGAASLS